MVKVTYIEANGTEHPVEVPVGHSLMEGAVKNNVPGILADCGGACACGTCKVYVAEPWREKTGTTSDMEDAMLDLVEDRTPGLRLACQIKVREDFDGIVLRMPARQF